jgi:CSLREA domain-containing protein
MVSLRSAAVVAALGVSAVGLSSCELPTVFVVDRTTDAVDVDPGDGACATAEGDCSLRAAVQEANETAGSVVVDLAPGTTYTLSITSGGYEDLGASGDLDSTGALTIEGNGATVMGASDDRFVDQRAGTLTIRDLTIADRYGDSTAVLSGVRVASSAVLERITLENLATCCGGGGAAVHQDGGTLAILDSRIYRARSMDVASGAVYQADGFLLVSGSEIDGITNPFSSIAGIEQAGGDAVVVNSRISGYDGTSTFCYRTICLPMDFTGQAIRAAGHVDVYSSHAIGKPATRTVDDVTAVGTGSVSISGSIVRWCSAGVSSAGFNRSDDPACVGATGDGAAADPIVDQVPTGTAPLCNGAPIFDHDRVHTARPQGAGCDIGDLESSS